MRLLRRLLTAALVAAPFSVLGTILYFVGDDPCGCAHPSDDCGYGYAIGAAVLLPLGFVVFVAAWGVSLNARLSLASRIACGLTASAILLGGFAALGFYGNAQEPPAYQQGGC